MSSFLDTFLHNEIVMELNYYDLTTSDEQRSLGYCEMYQILSPNGVFNIYRSGAETALYTLPRFSSSLELNYIAPDHMCMAYPLLTHIYRAVVLRKAVTEDMLQTLAVWYKGVITGRHSLQAQALRCHYSLCDLTLMCTKVDRAFGDGGCLTFSFKSLADAKTELEHDPHWAVKWKMGGAVCVNTGDREPGPTELELMYLAWYVRAPLTLNWLIIRFRPDVAS